MRVSRVLLAVAALALVAACGDTSLLAPETAAKSTGSTTERGPGWIGTGNSAFVGDSLMSARGPGWIGTGN